MTSGHLLATYSFIKSLWDFSKSVLLTHRIKWVGFSRLTVWVSGPRARLERSEIFPSLHVSKHFGFLDYPCLLVISPWSFEVPPTPAYVIKSVNKVFDTLLLAIQYKIRVRCRLKSEFAVLMKMEVDRDSEKYWENCFLGKWEFFTAWSAWWFGWFITWNSVATTSTS